MENDGYRLIAYFHTHPFVYDEESYYAPKRGPSDTLDAAMARRYPWVYSYIRALEPVESPFPGEWYYYGAKSLVDAP